MDLYLCGPMRGKPSFNFPLFNSEAARLRDLGHIVFNPAEFDSENGFDPDKDEPKELSHYLAHDLAEVCRCEAVACLPDWTESQGARIEVMVAKQLGKQILWSDTLEPVLFKGGETKATEQAAMLAPVDRTAAVLAERGKRYGNYWDQASISQLLLGVVQRTDTWADMQPDQRDAMTMFCVKMSRIVNGDPGYADNWRDIAGYATLVADRLDKQK